MKLNLQTTNANDIAILIAGMKYLEASVRHYLMCDDETCDWYWSLNDTKLLEGKSREQIYDLYQRIVDLMGKIRETSK